MDDGFKEREMGWVEMTGRVMAGSFSLSGKPGGNWV